MSLTQDVFRGEGVTRSWPRRAALVVAVPAILVAVYLLPPDLRQSLGFVAADPTVPTAFSAHFVHLSTPHLAANVLTCVLVLSSAYLLARSTGNLDRFQVVVLGLLLGTPFALSIALLSLQPAAGLGFSGLNMALFGYLLIEVADYLDEHLSRSFGARHSPALFFLGIAVVATLTALPDVASPTRRVHLTTAFAGVIACSLAGAVLCLHPRRRSAPDPSRSGRGMAKPGRIELLALVALVLVVVPVLAFSRGPAGDVGSVTAFVHFVGYCVGFLATYATGCLVGWWRTSTGNAPSGR